MPTQPNPANHGYVEELFEGELEPRDAEFLADYFTRRVRTLEGEDRREVEQLLVRWRALAESRS